MMAVPNLIFPGIPFFPVQIPNDTVSALSLPVYKGVCIGWVVVTNNFKSAIPPIFGLSVDKTYVFF